MFNKPTVLYVVIAAIALSVGLLDYLIGRQPEHVYFLFHGFSLANGHYSLFGVLGNNLPSFVHVYAFILLTVAIAGSTNARLLGICVAWLFMASLFEYGQHPAIAPAIAAALPAWFARVPVLDNTAAYFLKGTFDPLDLLSIAVGTVAAWLTVVLIRNRADTRLSEYPPRNGFRFLAISGLMSIGMLTIIGSGGGDGTLTPGGATAVSYLYVSGNGSNTLLSYNDANSVSGSAVANRTLTDTLTTLSGPRGIAVDMVRNQIYVANYSANSILVFNNARTATGNVAPIHTIAGGSLNGPTALFVDVVNNRLYVANTGNSSILIYDGASTSPTSTLAGGSTSLISPTGVYVDTTRNLLYVANGSNQILVFNNAAIAPGAINIVPLRAIPISGNPTGIFVDVMADRLYVASGNSILVFDGASMAYSASTPNRTLSGGGSMLNQPREVFVDTGANRLYVANSGDNSVLVFNNASTVNNPAVPNRTLSLPASTSPWGVYVDVTPIVIGSTATLDGYARSDITASVSGSPATGDKLVSFVDVAWRQFYSFDIASVPVNATIVSATLHLYQCDVVGTPYPSLGNNVLVDHVNFGNVVAPSIYDSSTVALNVGTLSTSTSLGYRSLDVMTSVQNDLAASRVRSQYRLRFSQDTNFGGTDNFVQFTDADNSPCTGLTTNQPPQLAVTLTP